ncbi:hypothetical protein RhiirC2_738697, partial [Rhizophagus irregularis]
KFSCIQFFSLSTKYDCVNDVASDKFNFDDVIKKENIFSLVAFEKSIIPVYIYLSKNIYIYIFSYVLSKDCRG